MWFILAAPACTDMLGTMFMMIGLLYVSVSVYQLVRCLVIVYVALLRVSWIHPPFNLITLAC
jgi:hypothetical protein